MRNSRYLIKVTLSGICLAFLFQTAAFAQSLGVQVTAIPVGTKFYYETSKGKTIVGTWVGKKGKYYLLKETGEYPNNTTTIYYNPNGHVVRRRYSNGFQETYKPFSCFAVLGDCQHRYKGGSKWNGQFEHHVTQNGDTYNIVESRINRGDAWEREYQLGQFNMVSYLKRGKYWERLVKIE